MEDDQPSTSGTSGYSQSTPSIDQDKIVFAFEREYFQNFQPLEQKAKAKSATGLFNPFQNGLQLRDQDLVDFLNERLGDHEETWAGKHVAAFLSREMIEELETCFQGLEPIAKLKIVLGFSQLSSRRLKEWKKEINTLLEIAAKDPDDWVEAIADMLRIFSPTGIIELMPTRNLDMYREGLGRVYHKMLEVANRENSEYCHVPEMFLYCDEEVIESDLLFTPPPEKTHFTLKKAHKAEQQREDCLKELLEPKPAEDKSGIVSSLPMKFRSTLRKPDLKTPMRGIVQPNATKINGGFTSEPKKFPRQLAKRDGGALLISIDDIPHAHLKRKKDIEKEEREKKKEQAEAEKKRLEAERKKAVVEKAELRKKAMKEAEKVREEAMKRRQEMEAAKLPDPVPEPVHLPVHSGDPRQAFMDPSLQLERLRQQFPSTSDVKMEEGEEGEIKGEKEGGEPMEEDQMQNESDKAVEWMFHHDEQMGDKKDDDYDFLNRPRPPGLESRETIIQKTATDLIDTVTCCTLDQQRQIVAFISGNTATFRPLLGNTNIIKISDSIQQGIVDQDVCRVRVESFVHLNFDSGEWRKQQRCKILAEEEQPRDFDGSLGPRLSHQQIFNEIARHISDETEDVKFAGQSVIVQAYVPSSDAVDVKLLSPCGSKGGTDVLYGQEVTAGEMATVQTGIAGCIRMRTVLGSSNILSPVLIAAPMPSPMQKPAPPPKAKPPARRNPPKAPARKQPQKQQPQPQQVPMQQGQQMMQPTYIQLSFDTSQLQQQQQHAQHQSMSVQHITMQPAYLIQQTAVQQPQHHQQQPQQHMQQASMPQQSQQQQPRMQQQRHPQPVQHTLVQQQHRQPQQAQHTIVQQQRQPHQQQHQMQHGMMPQQQQQHQQPMNLLNSPPPNRHAPLPVKQLSIPQFVQRSMVQTMSMPSQNNASQSSNNHPPSAHNNTQHNIMQQPNQTFYDNQQQYSNSNSSMLAMNSAPMQGFQVAQQLPQNMQQQQQQSYQVPQQSQMQNLSYHNPEYHGMPNQPQQQYRY